MNLNSFNNCQHVMNDFQGEYAILVCHARVAVCRVAASYLDTLRMPVLYRNLTGDGQLNCSIIRPWLGSTGVTSPIAIPYEVRRLRSAHHTYQERIVCPSKCNHRF